MAAPAAWPAYVAVPQGPDDCALAGGRAVWRLPSPRGAVRAWGRRLLVAAAGATDAAPSPAAACPPRGWGRAGCVLSGLLAAAALLRGGGPAGGALGRGPPAGEGGAAQGHPAPGGALLWQQDAPAGRTRYRRVPHGSCAEAGLAPVEDAALCRAAARELGLPAGAAWREAVGPGRPRGCYVPAGARGREAEPRPAGGAARPGDRAGHQVCGPRPPHLLASGIAGGDGSALEAAWIPSWFPSVASAPREEGSTTATTASATSTSETATSSTLSSASSATSTTRSDTATSGTLTSTLAARPVAFTATPSSDFSRACLRPKPEGCCSIRDRGECLRSRDGRAMGSLDGRRIRGEPCLWDGASGVCEAYDYVVKADAFNESLARASYEVAGCPELAALAAPRLFCFSLMRPAGYEVELLHAQLARRAGIFSCDDFAVFSNSSVPLGVDGKAGVSTVAVPGELSVPFGGQWNTALNTGVFVRVWRAVGDLGRYQSCDWTVKADPDSVFFPSRLRELLASEPMKALGRAVGPGCGRCRRAGQRRLTCPQHVRALRAEGLGCGEALARAAEPPPGGCGCACGDAACSISASSMYLNNCQFGLHGPVEVLSREAVAAYLGDADRVCGHLRGEAFVEDDYLRLCLEELGVQRADQFSLLSETACGGGDIFPCTAPRVTFHPFKDLQQHLDCLTHAELEGRWPE